MLHLLQAGNMNKIALLCFLITICSAASAAAKNPAAIFVFGDSTVDDGNNNFLPADVPKANYRPYGIDFPGGTPTGRFSNGFLGVDFIAKAFGFRSSPPPFHAIKDHSAIKYMRGVNFASSGAGILDTTGIDVIPMSQQIQEFGLVAGNITCQLGRPLADHFLAKSLIIVSIGTNDLFAKLGASIPVNDAQRDQIIIPIINKFKNHLKMLHTLGVRKFGVGSTAPMGCVPAIRSPSPPNHCNEELNALSHRFRNATKALLEDLSYELYGFKYSLSDSLRLFSDIMSDPSRFGFKEVKAACCRSLRTVNGAFLCSPNSAVCPDRDEYFFWDGVHPTQHAYKLISHNFMYGSGSQEFNTPVNLHDLVLG